MTKDINISFHSLLSRYQKMYFIKAISVFAMIIAMVSANPALYAFHQPRAVFEKRCPCPGPGDGKSGGDFAWCCPGYQPHESCPCGPGPGNGKAGPSSPNCCP